jgi:hypothetical protein
MLNFAKRSFVLYFASRLNPREEREVRDRVATIDAKEELLYAQVLSGAASGETLLDAMDGAFFFCGRIEANRYLIINLSGRGLILYNLIESLFQSKNPLDSVMIDTKWETSAQSSYLRREGISFVNNDIPENTVRVRASHIEYRHRNVAIRCNRMKANSLDLPPQHSVRYSYEF